MIRRGKIAHSNGIGTEMMKKAVRSRYYALSKRETGKCILTISLDFVKRSKRAQLVNTCIHIYIHTYIHAYIHTFMHTYILYNIYVSDSVSQSVRACVRACVTLGI